MSSPAQGSVPTIAEEFEAGGYWFSRALDRWLLVVVTLGFGLAFGVDVLYDVFVSDEFSAALAIAGLIAVGCVILLWTSVTLAVAAGAAVLVLALFVDSGAYSVLLALLLTGLAALTTTAPFRRSTLAVMLIWGVAYAATLNDPAVTGLALIGVSSGLFVAYGIGSSFRRATHDRLQSAQDLEVAEQRHEAAKTAERRSIARDLHDIVAHDITIIAMQSRAAQMKDTLEAYREALEVIGNSSRAALNDLRRVLEVLKEEDLIQDSTASGQLGAASALDVRSGVTVFAEQLERLGVTVQCSIQGELAALSRSVSSALYRMLQECTTNVAKFAGRGAECWIEIEVDQEHVNMRVTNTVVAAEHSRPEWAASRAGLIGVRDRAAAFGGVTQTGYDDAGRWRVCVSGMKQS
ncbi:sensor histidine kinase [Nesterenkonia sphaerica]|nr:histidine kinase [Nesterenkonia sphaerica]